MIDRLIRFYQSSHEGSGVMVSEIWRNVLKLHDPLSSALRCGDSLKAIKIIETLGPNNGFPGLENGKVYPLDDGACLPYFERLAHLAGVLPFRNPNQPSPVDNWKIKNIQEVVDAIESELGFQLSVPSCFGLNSGDGITLRFIMYYCAPALAIRRRLGATPERILEIGAGLGNLGLIASRWKSKSYTVIDLPQIAVLSAWFLSKCCGEYAVWLNGEPDRPEVFSRFYTCTDFEEVRCSKYDLVFNSDSLPEMPLSVQDGYINLIADCLTSGGIFYSANHEGDQAGQSSVLAAVKRSGRLNLVSRNPYGMLDGYVEEFYKI